jgi:hypothetical protein
MAVLRPVLPWTDFTPLRNCWLRDPRLSLKGKGLLGYLLSHAPGYRISQAQIIRENDDGKGSVQTGLVELAAGGYLTRTAQRDGGRFVEDDYVITDPFDEHGRRRPGEESARHTEGMGGKSDQGGKSATEPGERAENPTGAEKPPDTPGERAENPTGAEKPRRKIRPIEEERENTNPTPHPLGDAEQRRPTTGELFDEWWALYPKKVDKQAARKVWAAVTRRADADKIIEVTRRYPFETDPARQRYIKGPARWLRDGCWEDDLTTVAATSGNGYRPPPHARSEKPQLED